jgi:regulatory protein
MKPDYHQLFASALRYLGIRPRSQYEVKAFLTKKTTNTALITRVINELTHQGLLNDADFARWYIDSRSRTSPRSRRQLEQELRHKGVTTNDYRVTTGDNELAKLALQKKKNLKSHDQVIRFLASRGFSWTTIEQVLKNRYN